MITDIHRLQEILRSTGYTPLRLDSLGFILTNSTPSHTFTTAVVPLPLLSRISVLTSRDFFDERLATEIGKWLLTQQNKISLAAGVQLLDSFSCVGYGFSGILALGFQCHNWFVDRSSDLHNQTLEVFPTYKGEFSGQESTEEIDILRHNVVCTVDWRRSPSLHAQVIIINQSTGVITEQYGFSLVSMWYLMNELRAIRSENDSVIVRNYLGQEGVFSQRGDRFVIKSLNFNIEIQVDKDRIEPWVRAFLQDGF